MVARTPKILKHRTTMTATFHILVMDFMLAKTIYGSEWPERRRSQYEASRQCIVKHSDTPQFNAEKQSLRSGSGHVDVNKGTKARQVYLEREGGATGVAFASHNPVDLTTVEHNPYHPRVSLTAATIHPNPRQRRVGF